MTKTKLQIMREAADLNIRQLAVMAEVRQEKALKEPYSYGGMLHYEKVIRFLEGQNVIVPKPRKTIEYKFIAEALKCSVSDLVEEK